MNIYSVILHFLGIKFKVVYIHKYAHYSTFIARLGDSFTTQRRNRPLYNLNFNKKYFVNVMLVQVIYYRGILLLLKITENKYIYIVSKIDDFLMYYKLFQAFSCIASRYKILCRLPSFSRYV